jgi:hypothetical protein
MSGSDVVVDHNDDDLLIADVVDVKALGRGANESTDRTIAANRALENTRASILDVVATD